MNDEGERPFQGQMNLLSKRHFLLLLKMVEAKEQEVHGIQLTTCNMHMKKPLVVVVVVYKMLTINSIVYVYIVSHYLRLSMLCA